ncbi:MAG: HAD family hydrolase, partial [Pseudomonadota bacterium]
MKTLLKQPVALLLDLDGTLVDSAPDIAAALDATLSACGLPLAGIDNTRAWVGGGAPKLVTRALAALDPAGSQDHETVLAMLLEHYATQNGRHGAPYAGVTRTLRDCHDRGLLLACVTNKPAGLAEALLEQYGVADCFRFTIGGDTLATKKPDPLPVTEACRQLGTEAESAWMIGDSSADAG